jgi:hypothetical protein
MPYEIDHVHIELSSMCNARCPLCPRNFQGFPANLGLEAALQWFEAMSADMNSDRTPGVCQHTCRVGDQIESETDSKTVIVVKNGRKIRVVK